MAKTGYLKVEVKSDKDGRCIAKQIDRDHEFYVDPANLTLTKDIVDLLDKEMSEDKAILFLMQSGWLAKHEREICAAANKELVAKNSELLDIIERLTGTIKRMKEKRDMDKNKEITIDVKTRGMEEAHEQIEALADAYDGFPAQVNIKGARDCVFNIYPSQTKIIGIDSDPEGGDGK